MGYFYQRVSQITKVSSKNKPDGDSVAFGASAEKYAPLFFSDVSVVLAVMFLAALYLAFVYFANTVSASEITAQKIIELTNADRQEQKIPGLKENEKLAQAAEDKAADMIGRDYFSHNAPDGTTPWHWIEKTDYDYNQAGENLAMDFKDVEKMNQAWLNSPTHRANILNEKYKDIGAAVRTGIINGHETIIAVQMFGSGDKSASSEAIDSKDKASRPENISSRDARMYPELPLAGSEKEKNKFAVVDPMITNPAQGEVFPSGEVKIVGRASPASEVGIYDGEMQLGMAVTDGNGWFRLVARGFSPGEHSLRAVSYAGSGKEAKKQNDSREVSFRVDGEKPSVRYELVANPANVENYVLRAFSDEQFCEFEWEGEKVVNPKNRVAVFLVSPDLLSGVLKVSDAAGNKSYVTIDPGGLHRENAADNVLARVADKFYSDELWANGTGREALARNLDLELAMGGYNF